MAFVILDKSYLLGAPTRDLRHLLATNRVMMAMPLLFELLAGDQHEAAQCFARLPQRYDPLEIIWDVSTLLQYETKKDEPCTPLADRRLKRSFQFHPSLSKPGFRFTRSQQAALAQRAKWLQQEVVRHRETCSVVAGFFPALSRFPPGGPKAVIAAHKRRIADEPDLVRELYGRIRRRVFPAEDRIDESWAFFRWMQIHLLAAVDYIASHGAGRIVVSKKTKSDRIDLDYTILACLAGGIASRDGKLIERFLLARPDGAVFTWKN